MANKTIPAIQTNEGKVGIGQTLPTANLHVKTTAGASQTLLVLEHSAGFAADDENRLDFYDDEAHKVAARIAQYFTNEAGNRWGLKFYTNSNTAINSIPALTLLGRNAVGIGTANPNGMFHVHCTQNGSGEVYFTSNTGNTNQNNDSPKLILAGEYQTAGVSLQAVNVAAYGRKDLVILQHDANDYVTAYEAMRLSYGGTLTLNATNKDINVLTLTSPSSATLSNNAVLDISRGGGAHKGSAIRVTSANYSDSNKQAFIELNAAAYGGANTRYINCYDNDRQSFVVLANARVGIGTASPGAALEVSGSAIIGSSTYGSSYGHSLRIPFAADNLTDGTLRGHLQFDSIQDISVNGGDAWKWKLGAVARPGSAGNYNSQFEILRSTRAGVTDNPDFVINRDGNIGIGMRSPTNKIQISGGGISFTTSTGLAVQMIGIVLATNIGYIGPYSSPADGNSPTVVALNHAASVSQTWFYSSGRIAMSLNREGRFHIGDLNNAPNCLLSVGPTSTTTAVSGMCFGNDASANLYRSAASTITTDGSLTVVGGAVIGVSSAYNSSIPLQVKDNLLIGSSYYTFATLGTSSTGDLILTSNAYPANVGANTNIIFKLGTSAGGGPNEKMRIVSDGNVGIGTTVPIAKLHVSWGTDAQSVKMLGAGGSTNGNFIYSLASDWSDSFGLNVFATNHVTTARTNNLVRIHSNETSNGSLPLRVTAQGTIASPTYEALAVNYLGNVGIGTTNPLEKLQVQGNIYATDGALFNFKAQRIPLQGAPQQGTYKGYLILAKAYTSGFVEASYVIGKVILRRGTSVTGHNLDIYEVNSSRGYDGEIFQVSRLGTRGTRFLRLVKVTYGGVVYHAIETSSGGGQPSTEMYFEGSIIDSPLILTDETFVSSVSAFGNAVIFVDENSNVGIGTTSPAANLHVVGQTFLSNVVTSTAKNQLTINTNGANYAHFYDVGVIANNAIAIGGNGAIATVPTKAIMTWRLSTENVGIGLTNPEATSALHIKNTDAAAKVTIESADASESFINFSAQSSEYSVGFVRDGSSVNSLRFCAADGLSAGEVMRLQNTNVGIGTTVPAYRLDTEGASATSVVQNVRNPSTAWTQYALTRYQTDAKNSRYVDVGYFRGAGAEATRGFVISGLNSNILTLLEPSAYLGLGGVTAPLFNIDVASTQGKGIQLRYDTSTGYRAQITPYWNSTSDTRIDFAINRAENVAASVIMSVGYDTNVGINTTSPTQKLDIVGSYGAPDDNAGMLKIRGPGAGPTQLNFGVSADGGYGWIQATDIAVDNDRDIILGPLGGKVGIGTTSTIEKLHVLGNIHIQSESDSVGGGGLYLGISNSRNIAIRQTSTNKNFAIDTYNASESWQNRITILNAGGKVGIGTVSPTTLLSVGGAGSTSAASGITFGGDAEVNLYRVAENVLQTDAALNVVGSIYSASYFYTAVGQIYGSTYGNLTFFVGNSAGNAWQEGMFIKRGSYVGIGTTNPTGKLHIVSSVAGETVLRADGTNGTLFSVVDDLSDSLFSVNNSAGLPVLEVFADDRIIMGQYGSGDLVLRNNKVGIGTTNAVNKLSVIGGASIGSSTYNIAAPSNGLIVEGNVGIGTTNPAAKLQINNTSDSRLIVYEIGTAPYTATLELSSQVLGTYGATVQYTSDTEKLTIQNYGRSSASATQGGILFRTKLNNTTATDVMSINGFNGNVGIGTTIPSYKLDVSASVVDVGRFYNNQATLVLNVGSTNNTEYTDLALYTSNGNAQFFKNRSSASWGGADSLNIYTSNGAITFHPAGTQNAVYVDSNGSVGINKTSPTTKLDVVGSFRVVGTTNIGGIFVTGSSATQGNIRPAVNNGSVLISDDSGLSTRGLTVSNGGGAIISSVDANYDILTLQIGGTTNHTFDRNGNVGIGLTAPNAAKLHIKGNGSDPVLRVESASLVAGTSTASKTFVAWLPIMTGSAVGDKVFIPLFK